MDNDTVSQEAQPLPPQEGKKKYRTFGNKAFDLLVYPTIAFGAVFGFSLWATYQGKFGSGIIRKGYDKLTVWLAGAAPTTERLEKAKSYAMVGVSFMAGTALMAPIKWFEDSRQYWSKKIDHWRGTPPTDPYAYANEPKQSWLSVMGGRFLTFSFVYVIARTLGGHIDNYSRKISNAVMKENIASLENVARASRGWKIAFIASFETFYTALCATGVYLVSRGLARFFDKKVDERVEADIAMHRLSDSSGALEPAQQDAESYKAGILRPRVQKTENHVQAVQSSRSNTVAQVM